ncbi:hypothetical protein Taro_025289 [Colocasia esculenta]|uniref:Uncharacterized protein n=1 Tax=Colocasia esculenta TaxID=4460 RepID=A0A843VG45_COLES|nr:hypothetical protein [Colocasia esculenta]
MKEWAETGEVGTPLRLVLRLRPLGCGVLERCLQGTSTRIGTEDHQLVWITHNSLAAEEHLGNGRELFRATMGPEETARKRADKEMQERIISGRERDEDIEDEVEMYAEYVHDPDVQERRARAQSRAEAWEADQRAAYRVSFQGAQHEVGSGSGLRVLRVVDGDRRPSIGLVYAKLEAAKKKIREVSPRYAHLVLDVVEDRWDRQMSRDLHMADEEDPIVVWVARATTERGEYELDEEADDPEDPPRPNTFLARAVAEAITEEEGDRGNVGQPYSPHYEMDPEAEVDLLGDIELEHVERTIGGGHGHDDDDFERLMEGLPRTRSLREAPSQSRRRGSSTQMLEVAVVVTVEVGVEVVTVVREEEMVTVVREEEVKFSRGGHAGGSPVDSNSYETMISDFEKMSTQESVGPYGGHSYHPESTSIGYSSGFRPYSGYTATAGYLDDTTECSPSRLPDVGLLSQAVSTEIPYHDDMG